MASETLTLVINADSKDAVTKLNAVKKGLQDNEKSGNSLSGSLQKLKSNWLAVTAALATVAVAFNKVIKDASNLQEVQSKFDVVFKGQTQLAESFADTLVESYAMSTREAKQYLASVQDLLVPMGMAADKAAEMSNEVVKLAADLGSFNNVSTEQAMMDLQSALVGNYETMKKYGVVLNETVVKQEAMRQGLWDGKGMLDANTKAQIAFELAMRGSEAAQGDMIRTGDSWANISKKIQARVEDISAGIGAQMLPALSRLGNAFLNSTAQGGVFNAVISTITKTVALAINTIAQLITIAEKAGNSFRSGIADKKIEDALARQVMIYKQIGVYQGSSAAQMRASLKLYKEKVDMGLVDEATQARMNKYINDGIAASNQKVALDNQGVTLSKQMEEIDNALWNGEQKINEAKQEGIVLQEQLNNAASGGGGNSGDSSSDNKYQKDLDAASEYYQQLADMGFEHNLGMDAMELERYETNLARSEEWLGYMSQWSSKIGSIMAQSYQNDNIKLDNWYKKKKKYIEKTVLDEDAKAAALEKLDEQYNKKKSKNAREYAKTQKAIALVQAIVGTALAIVNALQQQPAILGIALAAVVGALGAAEIGLIASQEIPAAAEGALIKGSAAGSLIQAGEGGRSEAIIPLENDEAMSKLGGIGGGTVINVHIENLYGDDDIPNKVAVAFDRALYKLKQNKNSVLF